MTREEVKNLLPIIKAFAEGKTIQSKQINAPDKEWRDIEECNFFRQHSYRIKPKHRPFRTQEECWEEMLKHQPFGWIKSKDTTEIVQIGRLLKTRDCGCLITLSIDEGHNIASSYYYNNYTFADGTPFGVREE